MFSKKATPAVSFFLLPNQMATGIVSFLVAISQKATVFPSGFGSQQEISS
jgi:hypothetical protein